MANSFVTTSEIYNADFVQSVKIVLFHVFLNFLYSFLDSWQALTSPIDTAGWRHVLKNRVTFNASQVSEKTAKLLRNSSLSSQCPGGPDFSEIDIFESSVYIRSAFLWNNSVRMIALKKRDVAYDGLVCTIRLPRDRRSRNLQDGHNSDASVTNMVVSIMKASVRDLGDHHGLEYSAAYITCPLEKKVAFSPQAWDRGGNWSGSVSLSNVGNVEKTLLEIPIDGRCSHGGNKDAKDTDKQTREQFVKNKNVEFTVCSSILRTNFRNVSQLVEKIEMSRILGAGRVVFYNSSVSNKVDAVLRWYAGEWAAGTETLEVVVLPWHLPVSLR